MPRINEPHHGSKRACSCSTAHNRTYYLTFERKYIKISKRSKKLYNFLFLSPPHITHKISTMLFADVTNETLYIYKGNKRYSYYYRGNISNRLNRSFSNLNSLFASSNSVNLLDSALICFEYSSWGKLLPCTRINAIPLPSRIGAPAP